MNSNQKKPAVNFQKMLDEKINEITDEYQLHYLFSDFKKKNGFKRSIVLSEQYRLYRQNYCGCVFSNNK